VTATKESDDNYLVASSISTSIVISAYTPPPPPPPAPTPTHKVTYALGGATGTIPTQADVTEGLSFTVAAATAITKTGFTFNQWSDGTKNYAAGATYVIGTADVVLTATWSAIPPAPVPTHKVTYALGGGTGTAPTQADVAEGASFTLAVSTGLTKTGFTFHRWNDGANNYSPGASYTIATADVVLTATWLAVVTPTPTTPTVLVPVVKNSYFTSGVTVVNGSPVVVKGTSGSTVWSKQFPVVAKFTVLPKNTVAKLTITLPTGVIVNLPSGKTSASGAFTVPGMQFAKTGVYTLTIKVGKTTKKLKVTITK
jgi:hypothetical protein